jgi:alkyl sulfatase BDS1-like metallo-beta-lactamase superfamily hydrolase
MTTTDTSLGKPTGSLLAHIQRKAGMIDGVPTGVDCDVAGPDEDTLVLSEITEEGQTLFIGPARFTFGTVRVRAGHTLEFKARPGAFIEFVADRLILEKGARVRLSGSAQFIVRDLAGGDAGNPAIIEIASRNGNAGLAGDAGSETTGKRAATPGGNGGDGARAPGLPHVSFFADRVKGSFHFVGMGGAGGSGGAGGAGGYGTHPTHVPAAGGDGGKGGDGAGGGSIVLRYAALSGEFDVSTDMTRCGAGGKGGTGGYGGQSPINRFMASNGKAGADGRDSNPAARMPVHAAALVPPSPPTDATEKANADAGAALPFGDANDRQDWEDAARNPVLGSSPVPVVTGLRGRVIWNAADYDFLDAFTDETKGDPAINPSLLRNAKLNRLDGVYEVVPGIWQVRGIDLSVITFIKGTSGLIVIDPLTSAETAKAAYELLCKTVPLTPEDHPVTAVLYSHNHVDHFGGVAGLKEAMIDEPEILAPSGFLEAAMSENVYAGTAMGRRALYMYGNLLPRGTQGQVSAGLGLQSTSGTITLLQPTAYINDRRRLGSGASQSDDRNIVLHRVDGILFTLQLTPGTEAPAEMNMYFRYMGTDGKEYRVLHIAENCTHTMHNVLTLRGAKVRDPLAWANYLDQAITTFGDGLDVLMAAHHWPRWGHDSIIEIMEKQRDMYKYMNDHVLHLANQGYTMTEIGEMVALPKTLDDAWFNRGNYGSLNHDVKSVYQRYLGWFDGVPAHLHPLPPSEQGAKYLDYMGGVDAVLDRAQADYGKGEYRWVATVLNDVVFAGKATPKVIDLLASAYEQLGYQAESGPWRNFYLTGAQELRNGVLRISSCIADNTDVIMTMPTAFFLDFAAVLLNGPAVGDQCLVIDFHLTPELQASPLGDETWRVIVKNGVLRHYDANPGPLVPPDLRLPVDATVTATHEVFRTTLLSNGTFAPNAIIGDPAKVAAFVGLLEPFDVWFNIVTP